MLPSPSLLPETTSTYNPSHLFFFRSLMAVFVRCKRVTDPLDDRVKASICGCCNNNNCYKFDNNVSSSGSEHEAEEHCHSPCLSLLVDEFIQDQDSSSNADAFSEADLDASETDKKGDRFSLLEITKSIKKILNAVKTDQYINILSSHVSIATEMSEPIRSSGGNKSMIMRKIVAVLRELGHNAGICKTRWEKTGSVTAGGYEFIDVLVGGNQRYFVDIDFVGEFEIVRPTSEYNSLLKVLPKVYICGREELKEIVKLMCYASKKSLKCRDLHLPPWRKNQFMQLKWFGPNRRIVNPLPSSNGSVSVSSVPVRCRSVGFDAVSDGKGRFAATRT